jgi:hypothetical protein
MATTPRHPFIEWLRILFYPEWLLPRQSTQPSPGTAPHKLSESGTKVIHIRAGDHGSLPQGATRNGHANGTKPQPQYLAESSLLTVLGTDIHTREQVTISLKERYLGQYGIGGTGVGKTTLTLNMILSDTRQGHGVCLIEPHGDLVRAVISGIPEHRLKDVILLDLADSADYPVGINLYECPQPKTLKSIAATSSFVSHVFEKVWGAQTETTPRLMMVLRAITRTLIENSHTGATFCEIPLLLSHEGIRSQMVANLTNSSIASFWEAYNRRTQRDKDELTASTLNKVVSFLDQDLIRNIVGQSKTTLDFRRIMDEGKILLVSLSPQYEEASRLLGSVLIGRILMAAFSRADTPEEKRRPFMLYCDEYQRFATADFATLLAESRKFRIITVLSNQALGQLDDANLAAALQVGSLVTFRVSGDDSKPLARSFDAKPQMEQIGLEPLRSPVADVLAHLVRNGHEDQRVAKFAVGYLRAFERYCSEKLEEGHQASYKCFFNRLLLTDGEVQQARALLNACLYRCMSEKSADISIPPLAIYVLAAAQDSGMEYAFSSYIKSQSEGDFLGPHSLTAFRAGMAAFGTPAWRKECAESFARMRAKFYPWMAEYISNMLTELRYCMEALATDPLLVSTGKYVPQYRQRTYQDQENLIANELSQLPNFHARVRLLSGEHVIKTHSAPPLLTEREIDERIHAIKQRMLSFGICTPYAKVEAEIRQRHVELRERADANVPPPPPSHTTGRRNSRQKPPPART